MDRTRMLLYVLVFASLASLSAAAPAQYWGWAYLDFFTVPDGTNVSVWGDCYGTGTQVVASAQTQFGNGYYSVDVPIDNPATPGIDEGCDGGVTPISFSVDGYFTYSPPQNQAVGTDGSVNGNFNLYARYPFYLGLPANSTVTNNATPFFNWTHGTNAVTNFTLLIDDNSNFASPEVTHAGITGLNYTLNNSEALAVDGTYYWRIDVYVNGVYNESSQTGWFVLDTTPPTIDSYNPGNYSWQGTSPVATTVTTNENAECKYDLAADVAYGAKANTMTGTGLSHTADLVMAGQGNNIFYIQCQDSAGNTMNISNEENYYIRFDSQAPSTGTLSINNGDYYATSTTLDLAWSGFNDSGAGIGTYYYDFVNNEGTATSIGSTVLTTATLAGAGQGNVSVYVWASDAVPGSPNIGNAASDWVVVDTQDPVLYAWTQTPADVDEGTSGGVTIQVRVNDTTWNNSRPQARYQYNNNGWYAYQNMTSIGGNLYQFTIPEPLGGWSGYVNDWLHYEVQATDMVGRSTNQVISEFIDVFNSPPVISPLANQVAYERQNFSLLLAGTDPDGDTLTFTSSHNFTFVQLTANTSRGWWVPDNDDLGSQAVQFNVTDGIDTDSTSITIDVNPRNDAPVLSPVGDLNAYLHKPYMHYLFGYDPDNKNEYLLDNNILIFDVVENIRWFKIGSFFNVSNESYYGVINFTPLLSHRGRWNLTLYVTDGTSTDSENIAFTVGYCGDLDAGNEPWCDQEYESCVTCPEDCGACSSEEEDFMAIIIDPRNCLERNFTIWTYELYDRATCPEEGLIIEGMEVCENLSQAKLEVFQLQYGRWEKVDEYISDDNGEVTFVPTAVGEYKLVGTKRGYPRAYEYLEIRPCIGDREEEEQAEVNKTKKQPEVQEPAAVEPDEPEPPGEIEEEATTFEIILWYVVVPALMIVLIVLSYYYYEKEKDNQVWLLKARIRVREKYSVVRARVLEYWDKARKYLGYK